VQALIQSADEVSYDFKILKAVEVVNVMQKLHLMPKIESYFKGDLKGKHFALWGLAFNLIQMISAKHQLCISYKLYWRRVQPLQHLILKQ
jgi:hypothetical protein